MGRTLIWVTNGPKAGDFMEVDDEDADLAEAEGWGQRTVNESGGPRDGMQMRKADTGPHEKAEAYLTRREGYQNRELRAAPAPAPASPKDDDEDIEVQPRRRSSAKK